MSIMVPDNMRNPTTLATLGDAIRAAKGALTTREFVAKLGLEQATGLNMLSLTKMIGWLVNASLTKLGRPMCSLTVARAVCDALAITVPEHLWGDRARGVYTSRKTAKKAPLEKKPPDPPPPPVLPPETPTVSEIVHAADPLTAAFRAMILQVMREITPEIAGSITALIKAGATTEPSAKETEDISLAVTAKEAELAEREEDLRQRETAVSSRERWIETRTTELKSKQGALELKEQVLREKAAALTAQKTALDEREAELAKQENSPKQATIDADGNPEFAGVSVDAELIRMITAAADGSALGHGFPPIPPEITGDARRELLAWRTGKLQQSNTQINKTSGLLEITEMRAHYDLLVRSLSIALNQNVGKVGSLVSLKKSQGEDFVCNTRSLLDHEVGKISDWIRSLSLLVSGTDVQQRDAAQQISRRVFARHTTQ